VSHRWPLLPIGNWKSAIGNPQSDPHVDLARTEPYDPDRGNTMIPFDVIIGIHIAARRRRRV
jgi:hypothetical protein